MYLILYEYIYFEVYGWLAWIRKLRGRDALFVGFGGKKMGKGRGRMCVKRDGWSKPLKGAYI